MVDFQGLFICTRHRFLLAPIEGQGKRFILWTCDHCGADCQVKRRTWELMTTVPVRAYVIRTVPILSSTPIVC